MTSAFSWSRLTKSADSKAVPPVSGFTLTRFDSGVALFGGLDGRRNAQKTPVPNADLHVLNVGDGTFSSAPVINEKRDSQNWPPARTDHAAVSLVGNKILVFGGVHCHSPLKLLNDTWVLNCSDFTWICFGAPQVPVVSTPVAPPKKPPGTDKENQANRLLNTVTDMARDELFVGVKIFPHSPCPRRGHSLNSVGSDQVVLFGGSGGFGYSSRFLNDVHVYSVSSGTWTAVNCTGTAPNPRGGHGAACVGNKLYVFGGWSSESQYSDLFMLDIDQRDWSDLDLSWSVPRWNLSMVFVKSLPYPKLFVFGGSVNETGEGRSVGSFSNQIGVLDLNSNSMSWDEPVIEEPSISDREIMLSEAAKLVVPPLDPFQPLGREGTCLFHDETTNRLIVFGGWSNRWLNDMWAINISTITGPPYAVYTVSPSLGPVSGGTHLQIHGEGFQHGPKHASIKFTSNGQSVMAEGTILSSSLIECLSPNFEAQFGAQTCEIRIKIDSSDWTSTYVQFSVYLNTDPKQSVCYGPGLLEDGELGIPTSFFIQARDRNKTKRTSGGDRVVVSIQPDSIIPSITDLGDGRYTVDYTSGEERVIVHVSIDGEEVRGSPFVTSFKSKTKPKANTLGGPLVSSFIVKSMKQMDESVKRIDQELVPKKSAVDILGLINVINEIKSFKSKKELFEFRTDQIVETLCALERDGTSNEKTEKHLRKLVESVLASAHACEEKERELAPIISSEIERYKSRITEFESVTVTTLLQSLKNMVFYSHATGPDKALSEIEILRSTTVTNLSTEWDHLTFVASNLAIPLAETQLGRVSEELGLVEGFWLLVKERSDLTTSYLKESLGSIDLVKIEEDLKLISKKIRELKFDKKSDCFLRENDLLKRWLLFVPILVELKDDSMRDRHWASISKYLSEKRKEAIEISQSLSHLWSVELFRYADGISDITDQAKQEGKMERALKKISLFWSQCVFQETLHRGSVSLLKLGDDEVDSLEDHQVQIQNMCASRFLATFETQIVQWQKSLANVAEVNTLLQDVQKSWSFLENLFVYSEEVKKELPEDTDRFAKIDSEVRLILSEGHRVRNCVEFSDEKTIVNRLEKSLHQLAICEKSLNEFLERKRRAFPRFFFVSTVDLLDILSNGNSPGKVMPHLSKVFQAVQTYTLEYPNSDEHQRPIAVGMESCVGVEFVPFPEPLPLVGKVEIYLNNCIETFRNCLKYYSEVSLKTCIESGPQGRGQWICDSVVAQCVLLTNLITWVDRVEQAFLSLSSGDTEALQTARDVSHNLLLDLIKLTTNPNLDKRTRQKVMCMITLDAHNRDIQEKLVQEKVSSVDAFQWQAQLKAYFDPVSRTSKIRIADAIFDYGYEYLGNGPRLVVTPLTDRIYVTCTQALHLGMGCAPAGPAGTGKTESTKDLANALGKACFVFNASPEMDYKTMGNIFKGLAASGSWGCFDEFNRLIPEVLSVCSVQFKAVCDAIKSKSDRFLLQGDEITIDYGCGVFITMNPGYIGRSNLPSSLSSLFRPVTVMVADFFLIISNCLMSEGFLESDKLAKKFSTLYALCGDLLSKSKQYDWGMRAIKSVLVVAGSFKRADPSLSEEAVLMRALRDTNVAKIDGDDLKIFMGLLSDLFPGVDVPRARDENFESVLAETMEEMGYTNDPYLMLKITQLIELLTIRHCIFMMGPPGSFKSAVWRVLARAKEKIGEKVTWVDLNPKAISTQELYGYVNMSTREWKDGILSKTMRSLAQANDNNPKWIILDGDLDANWIESMNSVMDDNRLLTLPSNERIPLKSNMKMIFEIRDLNFATPATVTRAGVVNMIDYNGVQWKAFKTSWMKKHGYPESIHKCFENVGEVLLFIKKQCKLQIPMVDICIVQSLCLLVESMLPAEKALVAPRELTETIFQFCTVWAAGACLGEVDGTDYRKLFNSWFRADFKSNFVVKFPSKGSVFDYYVNESTGRFEEWNAIVPKIEYSPSMGPMNSITVPTGETVSLAFIAQLLIKQHHPVMLIGQSGSGKTQQCLGILKNLDPNSFSNTVINMNYYTDSNALQTMLEAPLEKKAGRLFGPPGKGFLIYYIDDLNMPQLDPYNTQSAISLLKQSQDYRHWYDRQKITLKDIGSTQLMCSMNPTAGSFTVDQRLQRHFWTCSVPFPDQTCLSNIYSTYLRGHFDPSLFKPQVVETMNQILKAGLALHTNVCRSFKKTAQNVHYEFNIRHLSGVFQGLLQMSHTELLDSEKAVLLWIHESERVYGDRLVSQTDVRKFRSQILEIAKKSFKFNFSKIFSENDSQIVFTPFSKGFEEPCYDRIPSVDRLTELCQEALTDYNETNPVMDLVLFEDAVKHLARISRIISSPGGHALMVGVGGSGRQSLSRLAGFICRASVTSLVISSSYGLTDLRNDLQSMFQKAGVKDERVLFILTDGQITNEKFLVYINDLLSCGDIADLYNSEEKDVIRNAVRSACKSEGFSDTPENLWNFFINRIKKNLKVSLCFSPVGDSLRTRARKFPALINCTVIDWFHPWPKEALKSVSVKFLTPIESLGDQETVIRKGVTEFMPFSFECVSRLSEKYMSTERRFAYTTPKSFLELIKLYGSMLSDKLGKLADQENRLVNGLEKLRSTQASVAQLEETLRETAVVVEQKAQSADAFAAQVAKEKEIVKVEADKAAIEKAKCEEIAVSVSAQQRSCEEDLAIAIPLVQKAEAALDVLNKKDFQELKSFAKPPPGVDKVCETVMYLLATIDPNIEVDPKKGTPKDPSWKGSQKMMGNPERFLESLKSYKGLIDKNQIPKQNIEKARPLTQDAGFTVESMKKKSNAAAGLCEWVLNIIMYYDVVESVEPKRAALREATATLTAANQKLSEVQALVSDLESKLARLIAELDAAMADKNAALAEADKCKLKLEMAQRLIGALGANGGIWEANIESIRNEIELLPGNVAIAASFVSYLSVFSREYRESCMKEFESFLISKNVPISTPFDPLAILTNEAELARWQTFGLPSDRFSSENGAIISNSQRFCLLLDPQLQGITWIKAKEKDNLVCTRMGHPKMMEVFEHAIEQGKTVLVENMGESIDAVLAPVIGRNFIKRGNNSRKKFIRLGEKEIEWNDNFKLYLHTMLSNPHYPPEVHAECTIINFTVTEQGLEDQLLFQTVKLERSDLAAQKSDLISQQNEFKLKLSELESLLLDKLANAQGDVLEDTELILSLEDAKRTSDEVREKVEIAKQTESIINRTSEYYRPCAVRGSLLFFFLMDLQKIHSFYRFSLESFVSVFTRAIQSSRQRPASSRKSSVSHVSSPAGSTTLCRRQGLSRDFDAASSAGGDETGSQNGDDATELSVRDLEMRVDLLTKTVSKFVFAFASRGLFDQDRLTAATMLCLTILRRSGALSSVEVDLFVQGSMHANPPPLPDQQKSWLTETCWSQLKQLELAIPTAFKSLTSSIEQEALSWKRWIGEEKAESCDLPRSIKDVSPFHKLMLLRILRPDRLCQGLSLFVSSKLGPEFVERAPFDIDKLYAESSNLTPIFFVLFPGVDPTPLVENLAKRLGITNGNFINISMGQGQEQIALNALSTAAKEGGWIMLQNIHLMQSWLKQLERALEQMDDPHPEFRCFLSSEPPPLPLMEVVPESILQKSVKIADEAPQDIKSNLRRAWSKFSQRSIEESAKPREFKACLFGLCLYHSLIIGRKKFGPQGWSRSYPFNDGDLEFSASVIANYLRKYESVPWPDLRYIISEIVYGGSITDALDRRANKTYVDGLIVPELLTNMTMTQGVKSPDPSKMDYAMYTKFIEERLPAESPQMFGLHPNAEYKFSSSQALGLLGTIQTVTGGSSSNAKSSSDSTLPALITKYLSQLPKPFDMLAIRAKITDWNPYIIVALQECERMNALVSEIRRSLTELEMGLSGALNITDQMEDLIRSMSINKVFGNWEKLAFPSLKPLSSWMTDLSQRSAQLVDWTTNLQAPKSVWISGLFNPMSYLTAVMQVAARDHNLPLDSMTLRCSVTNLKDPKIELSPASPPPPKGGVYIHGLFLEGASWEDGKGDEEGYLADPRPKVLHPLMPVVNVYAVPAKEMEWENMYHCPVYITSTRGPTYLFTANIHMEPDDEERKWILAGTALLLTDD